MKPENNWCFSCFLLLLLLSFTCFCSRLCFGRDTITSTNFIKDPASILSNGSNFELGFFNPVNSTNRYVGIWFKQDSPQPVAWVANRDKPLTDTSGVFTISKDGYLVVLDGQNQVLWSSNVSNPHGRALRIHLLEPFPSAWTFTIFLNLSFGMAVKRIGGRVHGMVIPLLEYWDFAEEDWKVRWSALKDPCDFYGVCGAFGMCDPKTTPVCSCLNGFQPKEDEEWNRGNWTGGCVRKTPLQCGKLNNISTEQGKEDRFFSMKMVKLPHFAELITSSPSGAENWEFGECNC